MASKLFIDGTIAYALTPIELDAVLSALDTVRRMRVFVNQKHTLDGFYDKLNALRDDDTLVRLEKKD